MKNRKIINDQTNLPSFIIVGELKKALKNSTVANNHFYYFLRF